MFDDFGSVNGMFVGGLRMSRVVFEFGNRVMIGCIAMWVDEIFGFVFWFLVDELFAVAFDV